MLLEVLFVHLPFFENMTLRAPMTVAPLFFNTKVQINDVVWSKKRSQIQRIYFQEQRSMSQGNIEFSPLITLDTLWGT